MALVLEAHLPLFDFRERHSIRVRAPPEEAWRAIREADLRRCVGTGALFALRAIPGLLTSPRATAARFLLRRRRRFTILDLDGGGFFLLGEDAPRELVLGTAGRFWRPDGGLRPTLAAEFAALDEPCLAKAAWSFAVETAPGGSRVTTETRVLCTDDAARRSFRRYWRLVRPFSGLVRREILRVVRREAERPGARG